MVGVKRGSLRAVANLTNSALGLVSGILIRFEVANASLARYIVGNAVKRVIWLFAVFAVYGCFKSAGSE